MAHDDDEMEPAERRAGGSPAWFFGGLLVGAVLLGLVWGTVTYLTEDSSSTSGQARVDLPTPSPSARAHHSHPASPTSPASTTSTTGSTSPTGSAGPTGSTSPAGPASPAGAAGPIRLERCVQAATALESPIDAAGPALDQWAVHVGAMNKLVVGAISLQQATAFWNQTRLAAQQHIRHFERAMARMHRDGADCPAPGTVEHGPRVLRPCVRTVAADTAVVRAARVAIDTWDQHVQDMDLLRMGRLSPSKATQMWLSMWQQGVGQIESYRAAVRTAARAPGCPGVDRPGSLRAAGGGNGGDGGSGDMPSMDMSGM